jgi:hypothetical protein
MRPKKWMSAEEHAEVARRLHGVMANMESLGELLLTTYGTSSKLGNLGERFCVSAGRTHLQELRHLLTEEWYAEGHGHGGMGVLDPYAPRAKSGADTSSTGTSKAA